MFQIERFVEYFVSDLGHFLEEIKHARNAKQHTRALSGFLIYCFIILHFAWSAYDNVNKKKKNSMKFYGKTDVMARKQQELLAA